MKQHIPVLLNEIIEFIKILQNPSIILDATLGLGGYSEAFLKTFPDVKVLGIDVDKTAISIAEERLAKYGDRFESLQCNFKDIIQIRKEPDFQPDVMVFDLGISNYQITEPARGFSYQDDGPLDMRMNDTGTEVESITAAEVINTFSAVEMSDIFRVYGEEKHAWKLAKGIVRYREKNGYLETTSELVAAIRDILPAPVQRKMGKHPARRIFQALRIYVNDELENLREGLKASISVINNNGMIIVVSYHSLEDRIVKHTFRQWKQEGLGNILTRKPVIPTDEEIEKNSKARSAKMRVFQKVDVTESNVSYPGRRR